MKRWIKGIILAAVTVLMSYCFIAMPVQAASSGFFPSVSASNYIRGYCYRLNELGNRRAYVYTDEACRNRNSREYVSALSDECYIIRMSSRYNTVYVSYPTTSGRKTRWMRTDSFTDKTSASKRYATSGIRTYKFASTSYGYGNISSGDLVYVYETYGNFTRVVYPLSTGGYKMAWIRTTDANSYLRTYQTISNGNYVITSAVGSSMVMDVYAGHTANGTNIQLYRYNGGNNQKFQITSVGNGWYTIRNVASKKAVDVAGGVRGSEINVQLWDYNGSDAQLWRFYSAGNGYYYIQNKLGYYLDVRGGSANNETNIWVYSLNGSNAQKWKLSSTTVISESSTLRISGQAYPGTMNQGSGFTIRGTISSNYKITKVRCGIYNSSGAAVSEKTVYPNSYSYNVNSIDSYIHFSYAKPGTNYYRVWATDAKGTKLLQNSSFTVNAGGIPINRVITVFNQTDARWKDIKYGYRDSARRIQAYLGKGGDGNSGSGCGVLALTNAIYYLNGTFIHPSIIASYSLNNGYRINGVGTDARLYKSFANNRGSSYGFAYVTETDNWNTLTSYLKKGYVAICSKPGHLMAIVNYNPSNSSYLLLDSFPTYSRGTKPKGYIWASQSYLKNTIGLRSKFYVLKSTK